MSQVGVGATPQYLQNRSFDPEFGTFIFQSMGFDGQNIQRPNGENLQMRVVESGGYTYFCFAAPGTALASELWQVFRMDDTGNLLYADGDANYDNAATDPTTLSYSYTWK